MDHWHIDLPKIFTCLSSSSWNSPISQTFPSWNRFGFDQIFQYPPAALLMVIFQAFGVPSSEIEAWISLTNDIRKVVIVDGHYSDPFHSICGAPEGDPLCSCLGMMCLLWLLYVRQGKWWMNMILFSLSPRHLWTIGRSYITMWKNCVLPNRSHVDFVIFGNNPWPPEKLVMGIKSISFSRSSGTSLL